MRYKVADYLKQHDVPVVLTSVLALPAREDEPYDVNYSAPGKLAAAGVQFAIARGSRTPTSATCRSWPGWRRRSG